MCRHGWGSPLVLVARHGLQVVRVDTAPVTAQMIEFQAVWDRADQQFVSDAVC